MKTEYERNLHHAWMILEFDEIYEEDYQMRMLAENHLNCLLDVKGQGMDRKSRYQYEVGGKTSMAAMGERQKWNFSRMKEFMQQFVEAVREVNNYLLDVNCLNLDPEYIYYQNGRYFFCYCPTFKGNIWEAFHVLTEYFVRETDYEDKEAIYLACELHKASMEDNYNIEQILERILERKEQRMEDVKKNLKYGNAAYELKEDQILDDWAGEQELKGNVMKDRETVWGFVTRKIRKRNHRNWENREVQEENEAENYRNY